LKVESGARGLSASALSRPAELHGPSVDSLASLPSAVKSSRLPATLGDPCVGRLYTVLPFFALWSLGVGLDLRK